MQSQPSVAGTAEQPSLDGRVVRGTRNRQAIVDAALVLVGETQELPTAKQIAERAGVATRSIFHHFPDLESLLADAAQTQASRHWVVLQPPEPGKTFDARLAAAVAQRAELFEHIGALRRVAVRYERQSPQLAERLNESRAGLRRHLRRALGPEMSHMDRAGAAAVLAVASWETWEVLRRDQNMSVRESSAAVTVLITAALAYSLVPAGPDVRET